MPAQETNLLGRYVAVRRQELGLSQEALARRLHMNRDELGRIERGERKTLPPVGEVRSWAAALTSATSTVEPDFLERLRADSAAAMTGAAGDEDLGLAARIWPHFPQEFEVELTSAQESVIVWQTWLPVDPGFVESLAQAHLNGATIRCLMLDPTSDVAIERAEALQYPNPAVHLNAAMTLLVAGLTTIRGLDPCAVVRLDSRPPVAQLYATERRMLIGWFFPGRPSTVMPQVDVDAGSPLAATMSSYFDSVWSELPEPDLSSYGLRPD